MLLSDCFDIPLLEIEVSSVLDLLDLDPNYCAKRGYLKPTFPLPGRVCGSILCFCLRDFLVGAICLKFSGSVNADIKETSDYVCDCLIFSIEIMNGSGRTEEQSHSCYYTLVKIDMVARLAVILDGFLSISLCAIFQICDFALKSWKVLSDWFDGHIGYCNSEKTQLG